MEILTFYDSPVGFRRIWTVGKKISSRIEINQFVYHKLFMEVTSKIIFLCSLNSLSFQEGLRNMFTEAGSVKRVAIVPANLGRDTTYG